MPDLRTWLNEVDKLGQLMTVENAHWDLELSTLTEIINERSKTRPAILFDRIKDYPARLSRRGQSGFLRRALGAHARDEGRHERHGFRPGLAPAGEENYADPR